MTVKKYLIPLGVLILMINAAFVGCSKDEDPIPDPIDITDEDTDEEDYETLIFTPNESFFSPVGTLTANLRDKTTGNIYNKYEYYDYIKNWSVLTDTIVYGIDIKTAGNLIIKPEMGIPTNQNGSKLFVYLNGTRKEITLSATDSENTYEIQDEAVFEDVAIGFYKVKLQLKSIVTSGSSVGNLKNVHLTGSAAKNSENVMRRYRANAVHCSWRTASSNPVEISVHELTIKTKNLSYYQPITTPFGYTGSTWDKGTQTFGGYNFSLWSYGANDPVPPFYQESHLIAVGPGLEFGTYGHEGTGVKPRGNHPYVGVDTNVQTIAVRKVPGEKYDTYWSYYLNPIEGHWELYGCGRKYNKSGAISYLNTGAFVEVPGAASKARSGHETCETAYRGWQLDTSGNWHPINSMVGTTGDNNVSFRDWTLVGNKFSMQMGGWGELGIAKKTLILDSPDTTPNYLKGAYLEELYKMPATFVDNAPIEILNKSAKLSYKVTDLGTNASAEIFWGPEEGLTKEDKWMFKKTISIQNGVNTVDIDGLTKNTDYFYRIKIVNNEGIVWSMDTQEFKTADEVEQVIAPVVSFSSSSTAVNKEGAISFSDTSLNTPDTWTWTFEGGTPNSSNEKNPTIIYNIPGMYTVVLTVSNTEGTDTVTKNAYITVSEGGSGTTEVHYNFDGDLTDASSFQRNLSTVGTYSPSYISDKDANANKAYEAPGDGTKYLTNSYKGVGTANARSVTAWFKTTDAGSRKTIVSWGQNLEGEMFNVMIHDGRVRIEAGSSSLRGTVDDLDDDTWHHLAVTYDSNDGDKLKDVKIYVDGVLDTNTADGTNNSYRSEDVIIDTDNVVNGIRIGSAIYSNAYYWRGALDDVRVYSVALTIGEIIALTQ